MNRSSAGSAARRSLTCLFAAAVLLGGTPMVVAEEDQQGSAEAKGEQSLESKANDATAAMWTFQFAWEGRTWKEDEGPDGEPTADEPPLTADHVEMIGAEPVAEEARLETAHGHVHAKIKTQPESTEQRAFSIVSHSSK